MQIRARGAGPGSRYPRVACPGMSIPDPGHDPVTPGRDEFLSEGDLDLANLTYEELLAYWQAWLVQAQSTNEQDADVYSHGVFAVPPPPPVGGQPPAAR
jgi:hypothetical protein